MSEYYVPPVSDSTEIIQGLETVAVRLKEESVVKYLSQTIYSSWTSALRELYANELTAAKKAKREYKAEPTIELRLDPETRELIIWGRESLGITGEKLKILRYYGRSGNFSGEDAGQFGFGFKSYTLLSDEIRVETYARETRERYGFIGVRGVELRPLKDEELTIGEHGTKVSIVIRGSQGESLGDGEGKEIRLGKVIESLQDVCRFAEIDTYLVLTSPLKRKVQHSFRFSAQEEYYFETEKEAGREKLNHTPKEYAKIVHGANPGALGPGDLRSRQEPFGVAPFGELLGVLTPVRPAVAAEVGRAATIQLPSSYVTHRVLTDYRASRGFCADLGSSSRWDPQRATP